MKKVIYECALDEVDFCQYDGMCLFSEKVAEHWHGTCNGPCDCLFVNGLFMPKFDRDELKPSDCPFCALPANAKIKVIVELNEDDEE